MMITRGPKRRGRAWRNALFLTVLLGLSVPAFAAGPAARYVFLFIGDGMGPVQLEMAQRYRRAVAPGADNVLIDRLPVHGRCTTGPAGHGVTDSAAAGTALATGIKTLNSVIAMDVWQKAPLPSITDTISRAGLKVGVITSVSLDHATPACFYAHQPSRGDYAAIAAQLPGSVVDYAAGGGLLGVPASERNGFWAEAQRAGMTCIDTRAAFDKLAPPAGRTLVLAEKPAAEAALPYALDVAAEPDPCNISLAELTRRGIELLDNPDGFFFMIEGGKIDWAGHANDAATLVHEVLALDDAVQVAHEFYQQHPEDTLIVVTADHETGGLSMAPTDAVGCLAAQRWSYEGFNRRLGRWLAATADRRFEEALTLIQEGFGLHLPDAPQPVATDATTRAALRHWDRLTLDAAETGRIRSALAETVATWQQAQQNPYGKAVRFTAACTAVLAAKAGVTFTSTGHSAEPVPVRAVGAGRQHFAGDQDNTDIPRSILAAMDLAQRHAAWTAVAAVH